MVAAVCSGALRRETRSLPSSAMVLADRWAQSGCSEVVLTDPRGADWAPEAFRAKLTQMKKLIGAFR